ncbi:gamma-glutamyltransferase family protein [Gayadomonas joobiniege]|uniref:gamma-glutamyltransferase family protein n=1 Tax=Gayadomonas joobiniege TaxID=1234606 RepID=UPI0003799C96|nr:gamma-glutamyltransferase [Gayadomonas joobiniege]
MSQQFAFTAPHQAATDAAITLLSEGATACEAMVCAAAVISVVYPHMNSIGGDGFWLIDNPNAEPIAIDACGRAPFSEQNIQALTQIDERGGLSALTQAGTISGWKAALTRDPNAKLPLSRILEPAISVAKEGFTVNESLVSASRKLFSVTQRNQAFKHIYEPEKRILTAGENFTNPALANTFSYLSQHGLAAFYQGELAESFAKDLADAGSLLTLNDINKTQAQVVSPLSVKLSDATCYNLPAPTQGVHSLQILAILDRLKAAANTEAQWVHLIVEASKQSFALKSQIWADPNCLNHVYDQALSQESIRYLADNIQMNKAHPYPFDNLPGDTVWMGARDKNGQMVSFIQSVYWEFGSGIAMQEGGFVWNNRATSFSLLPGQINKIAAGKKPAHTLNPALAHLKDGRKMVYGTMGGEGQPQTQAAIFSRYVWRQQSLASAISQPRWLLGRTWGDDSNNLKVEASLAAKIADSLDRCGHNWQTVADNNEIMGHAGAIVQHPNGHLEAATDPRSDGAAKVLNL